MFVPGTSNPQRSFPHLSNELLKQWTVKGPHSCLSDRERNPYVWPPSPQGFFCLYTEMNTLGCGNSPLQHSLVPPPLLSPNVIKSSSVIAKPPIPGCKCHSPSLYFSRHLCLIFDQRWSPGSRLGLPAQSPSFQQLMGTIHIWASAKPRKRYAVWGPPAGGKTWRICNKLTFHDSLLNNKLRPSECCSQPRDTCRERKC